MDIEQVKKSYRETLPHFSVKNGKQVIARIFYGKNEQGEVIRTEAEAKEMASSMIKKDKKVEAKS